MDLIHRHTDAVNIYGAPHEFLEPFGRLPTIVGHVFAVFWCNAEVNNGGLHQFFSNPTGVLAPEAVVGMRAIGLHERAKLIEDAVNLFGPDYPRDQDQRGERLAKLERPGKTRREWDPFYEMDRRYYAIRDSLAPTMDRYAATGGAG